MKRLLVSSLALGALILFVASAASQPGRDKGDKKDGPPGGPPPRFQLGNLFPPHFKEELKLSKEQEKQIAELEMEVKAKLEKILTADQKKMIETIRPPRGPGGPGERPEKDKGDRPERSDRPEME